MAVKGCDLGEVGCAEGDCRPACACFGATLGVLEAPVMPKGPVPWPLAPPTLSRTVWEAGTS